MSQWNLQRCFQPDPPQGEMDFDQVAQVDQGNDWPDMDQSTEATGKTWN